MINRSHSSGSKLSQRGLSLIELMIGIALSLLILTAVLYSFAGSRASYQHLTSFSAVQESGRIALELLNRDLRMAGNSGCGNINSLDHRSPLLFSNAVALKTAPGASATESDAITVQYGSALAASVADSPSDKDIELVNLAPLGVAVKPNDVLLLSDCTVTEVVKVASVTGKVITVTTDISPRFRTGSVVMRLETVEYKVEKNPLGNYELMRNGQAVADGVTKMQILYGISGPANRSALEYVKSPTDAAQAVSVRLALTVADGAEVSQPFFSTVALRNRAP